MDFSEAEAQRLVAQAIAEAVARPVRGRYAAALEGHYPDGSVARIVSGAGAQRINHGRCVALVGSELDNGDWISGPDHAGMTLTEFADTARIPGLFGLNYVTPRSNVDRDG